MHITVTLLHSESTNKKTFLTLFLHQISSGEQTLNKHASLLYVNNAHDGQTHTDEHVHRIDTDTET